MSSPDLTSHIVMKGVNTQLESAMNERSLNTVAGDRDVPSATECKRSEPIPSEMNYCQTSDGEQQTQSIGRHEKLHHVIVRECLNCNILSETNEFCFNLLENKLGHRPDAHLEKERTMEGKGPVQYFGKALEHCSKCGTLQIHRLFTNNNENLSLRLNLGGFSPVLLHNVFKTCESKGSDIECRLVILGARPRSSPAYAFLSEHSKPCSTFCQHCHYESSNSHRSQLSKECYSTHQLHDHFSTFANDTYDPHQLNNVSASSSSQAPLGKDTIDDSTSSVSPTSHLSLPPSTSSVSPTSHLSLPPSLQRISPSQHASIFGAYLMAKSSPYEIPKELDTTTPQSDVRTLRGKSSPIVDIETMSCKTMKCVSPAGWEGEFVPKNSPALFHPGKTRYEGVTSPISNAESKTTPSCKEAEIKPQNKRFLGKADERGFATPAKRFPCEVLSSEKAMGISVSNVLNVPQSLTFTYPQTSVSKTVITVDCTNVKNSMPGSEIASVQESLESSSETRLSVASLAAKDITPAGVLISSELSQVVPALGECHLKVKDESPSQTSGPKRADTPETENSQLTEKTYVNIAGLKSGKEEKSDVSHWSNEDVTSFLKRADCGEYTDLFMQEDIDGQSLLLLNEERLHNLLGIKMGPAMKIARHIRNLQASLSHETDSIAGK